MKPELIENYSTKLISEFTPGDTLYIKKVKTTGFYEYPLCEFISYEKGVVTARVLQHGDANGLRYAKFTPGMEVTARLKSCYIWGASPDEPTQHPHCLWFFCKDKPAGMK